MCVQLKFAFSHSFSCYRHRLVKSKLEELHNKIVVANDISAGTFNSFNATLKTFNEIWKKQEEQRRKKAIEEESLYVTK